ncbi:MAG: lysoplasmalogenase family protein [Thermodesulfobacteriota bacterium]
MASRAWATAGLEMTFYHLTQRLMDRREFIGITAAGLGALSLGLQDCNSPHSVAPSDWVNVGVIGVGGRGQHMIRMLLRVPGVRITGLCDIYEPRFAEGRKVTGEPTAVYTEYRKLLEARDIDAVLVATPLGLHAEHVIAALDSGRPVYGEKSLGRTVEDCNCIRDAVRRTGRIFQVGLIAFLLGHLFYIFSFLSRMKFSLWISSDTFIIFAVSAMIFLWLRPYLKSMLGPVLVYIVVISLMLCGAWAVFQKSPFPVLERTFIFTGAFCFYLSDIFVARDRFIKPEYLNRLIGLPLYYLGQFLLAFSAGIRG